MHPVALSGSRPVLAAILACFGVALLGWSFWPLDYVTERMTLDLAPLDGHGTDTALGDAAPAPASQIPALISLEYPRWARVGDDARIRLRIASPGIVLSAATVTTVDPDPGVVPPPAATPSQTAWIQARLDMAGSVVSPAGDITSTWSPGEGLEFVWKARMTSPGSFAGTAWTFLLPVGAVGIETARRAIAAQPMQIEARAALGLSAPVVRGLGAFATLFATVTGLPLMDSFFRQRRR
ncbi:MAG TPA: hypothetical protein VFH29_08225 [Anaerolineales bacterium]|nr:hypothetical protein [Anaerolineales bacterium]